MPPAKQKPAAKNVANAPMASDTVTGTVTGTATGQEWAIQVGAFSRQAPAQQAASQAKSKLPKTLAAAHVLVLDGSEDGSKFFRARLTGLTEASARSACRQLEQRGMGCITVGPEIGSNRG